MTESSRISVQVAEPAWDVPVINGGGMAGEECSSTTGATRRIGSIAAGGWERIFVSVERGGCLLHNYCHQLRLSFLCAAFYLLPSAKRELRI